jgi:hypothetical protein
LTRTCSIASCLTWWAMTAAWPRSSSTFTSIVKQPSTPIGLSACPISQSQPPPDSPEARSRAHWHTFRIVNSSPVRARTQRLSHFIASSGLGCALTAESPDPSAGSSALGFQIRGGRGPLEMVPYSSERFVRFRPKQRTRCPLSALRCRTNLRTAWPPDHAPNRERVSMGGAP